MRDVVAEEAHREHAPAVGAGHAAGGVQRQHVEEHGVAGLDGGIFRSGEDGPPPLVVLKADDLEDALARVQGAGGEITEPIFDFPGGRRFHFRDPAGNVLGVWGE